MMRKVYIVGLVLLLTITGCNNKEENKRTKELIDPVKVPMETAVVEKRDIIVQKVYEAQIVPKKENLCFDSIGIFGEYKVVIGDNVKEGQELATLATDDLELEQLKDTKKAVMEQYEMEQENLENQIKGLETQPDFDQNKKIYEKQIEIWMEQLELSKKLSELDAQQLQHKIDKASERKQDQVITAPFDGTVVTTDMIRPGSGVGTSSTILTIVQDEQMYISCNTLSKKDIENAIEFYAIIGGKEYKATYKELEEDEDKAKGVLFEFENQNGKVNLGESATIIMIEKKKTDALSIPSEAVYNDTSGKYVYVVNEEKKEKVDIETGISDLYGIEVTSGLQEGDKVYVQN